MNSTFKLSKRFIGVATAITLVLSGFAFIYGQNLKVSSPDTSEVIEHNSALIKLSHPSTFSELYQKSETAVEGIIEEVQEVTNIVKAKPGTPEAALLNKNGKDSVEFITKQYKMKVLDSLKGNNVGDTVIIDQAGLLGSMEPSLETGDHIIFLGTTKNGKLVASHPTASYLKVENDKIEINSTQIEDFMKLEGTSLDEFKKRIK